MKNPILLLIITVSLFSIINLSIIAKDDIEKSNKDKIKEVIEEDIYSGAARLIISDGPAAKFNDVFLSQPHDKELYIKNFGTIAATKIKPLYKQLKVPFSFKGGKYPGQGGDCESSIRGGQQCKVIIRFNPSTIGEFNSIAYFSYFDGKNAQLAERALKGRGMSEGCVRVKKIKKKFASFNFHEEPDLLKNYSNNIRPGDYRCFFMQNSILRRANLHVPPRYQSGKPISLLLAFHGGAQNSFGLQKQSSLDIQADVENFAIVYPDGLPPKKADSREIAWKQEAWRHVDKNSAYNDVQFVSQLLSYLSTKITLDKRRIFATGIGNGASMAYRLACELPERIAAIAPVGGGMISQSCYPSRPVPILHFHGTKDPNWPFDGGASCLTDDVVPPIMETAILWQKINRCPESIRPKRIFARGKTVCYTRGPCTGRSEVTFCTVGGGGGTWPGGKALAIERILQWDSDCTLGQGVGAGKISKDISTNQVMWDFFKKHPLP